MANRSRRTDAEIEFDVRDMLHSDLRLTSGDIEAVVKGGVAHLTGTVPGQALKALAGNLAERVKGVKRVDNRLTVVPRSPRSDVEITADVSMALAQSSVVDEDKIEVTTVDGVVYLRGTVESQAARREADEAARRVPDVLDVINELIIAPSYARSDREIASEVSRQIVDNLRIDGATLKIDVAGGVAHLHGEVATVAQRWLADELARWTPGVLDVVNELKIRAQPRPRSA